VRLEKLGLEISRVRVGVTFVTIPSQPESDTIHFRTGRHERVRGLPRSMEVLTPKTTRRSTRLRVEIPVSIMSLDRQRPFAERCELLVVSAQGCGFRSTRALPLETPVMINDLPGGGSVTARVASCVPLGNDQKYFLIGAALYTHGNVWGIQNAPEDWGIAAQSDPVPASTSPHAENVKAAAAAAGAHAQKKSWPYNLFSDGAEARLKK
jgi:hypothetical protein